MHFVVGCVVLVVSFGVLTVSLVSCTASSAMSKDVCLSKQIKSVISKQDEKNHINLGILIKYQHVQRGLS